MSLCQTDETFDDMISDLLSQVKTVQRINQCAKQFIGSSYQSFFVARSFSLSLWILMLPPPFDFLRCRVEVKEYEVGIKTEQTNCSSDILQGIEEVPCIPRRYIFRN